MKLTVLLASAALAAFAGPAAAVVPTPAEVVDQYAAATRAQVDRTLVELEGIATAGLRDLYAMHQRGARPYELLEYAQELEKTMQTKATRTGMQLLEDGQAAWDLLVRLDARPFYFDALNRTFGSAVTELMRGVSSETKRIETALARMT